MKKILLIITALLTTAQCSFAKNSPGTTSAEFLKKAIGARPASLGEAYTAMTNDPDAYFFNPGSLATQKNAELSAMYQTGLADIAMGSLMYAHPLGIGGGIGLGVLYSDAGSIDVKLTGQQSQYKKAMRDTAYMLGYAATVFNTVSIGSGGKYIQSQLVEDYNDSTTAMDAGLLWETPLRGLIIAGSALNIGKGLAYIQESDPLPQTTRAGISYLYKIFTEEENFYSFLISADNVWAKNNDSKSGAGLECSRNQFALRLGYKFKRDIDGFTAGFGMRWGRYSFDYAFGLVQDLDHNHRVSFHIALGNLGDGEFSRAKQKPIKTETGKRTLQ
jgi:hypothetical protein